MGMHKYSVLIAIIAIYNQHINCEPNDSDLHAAAYTYVLCMAFFWALPQIDTIQMLYCDSVVKPN